jgi:hypothetical protein
MSKTRAAPAAFLTPADLVKRWGNAVCVGTLSNWRVQGRGPDYVKVGTRVAYPLDKVQSYERKNRGNTKP